MLLCYFNFSPILTKNVVYIAGAGAGHTATYLVPIGISQCASVCVLCVMCVCGPFLRPVPCAPKISRGMVREFYFELMFSVDVYPSSALEFRNGDRTRNLDI